MKKILAFGILSFAAVIALSSPSVSHAQTPSGDGMAIYQKFITGGLKCTDMKDSDFNSVGDYVLKQVPESQRAALNVYMDLYKNKLNNTDYTTMMGKIFTGCEIPSAAGLGAVSATGNDRDKSASDYANAYKDAYRGYGYGMMGAFGIFHAIRFIIGLIILFFIIKFVIKYARRKNCMPGMMDTGGNAVEILKERYAKGDITKEEYEAKKKELNK